jgi:hypothetical protein
MIDTARVHERDRDNTLANAQRMHDHTAGDPAGDRAA